jgi:hypothetical protein
MKANPERQDEYMAYVNKNRAKTAKRASAGKSKKEEERMFTEGIRTIDHEGNPLKMPDDPTAKSAVHALVLKIAKQLKSGEALYVFDASLDKDGKIRNKKESGFLWGTGTARTHGR